MLSMFDDVAGLGSDDGVFHEQPCGFERVSARCGFMRVPQDHFAPGGIKIQFPVVILSDPTVEAREPVAVVGGGGPGNSLNLEEDSVFYYRELFEEMFLERGHAVILMDQRGVGRAIPSTGCVEVVEHLQLSFAKVSDERREWDETRAVLLSCQRRLSLAGIDLRHYDTLHSAVDVEALRVALGIERWILYGVSYGGQLALEVMRRYSASVHAAILDSPATQQFYYFESAGHLVDAAIERLFDTCKLDTTCRGRFPSLRANTLELLARLSASPVEVMLTHPYKFESYRFVMDRRRLSDVLFDALYDPANLATLPAALSDAHGGFYAPLTPFIRSFLRFQFDDSFGDGLAAATNCRDEVANSLHLAVPDYRELFSGRESKVQFREAVALCDVLKLGTAGPQAKTAVNSDIRTLILSGENDPITPPHIAEELLQHLSNATLARLPDESHHVLYNECAQLIVARWLERDEHTARNACARQTSIVPVIKMSP